MESYKDIKVQDFTYELPEERIAKFPLEHRDDSKLLVFSGGNSPRSEKFKDISEFLPSGSLMVFNNTKVVPARLIFQRETGAVIEVFCLEPVCPSDYQKCFSMTKKCRWKAIVGNVKRWKSGKLSLMSQHIDNKCDMDCDLKGIIDGINLKADLIERCGNSSVIEFNWSGGYTFSQVMHYCGKIPIPPYLNRDTEPLDYERYQTYYALNEGSVAAPTAGLHFTEQELKSIDNKSIKRDYLCLHVGAGTFLPVKSDTIGGHDMHSEPFSVSRSFLISLKDASDRDIIAVGTTSTRCLESLYFLGVQCIEMGEPSIVEQWEPYREEGFNYSLGESIDALLHYMDKNGLDNLVSHTKIIIVPGYKWHVISWLVTNFHQPQSTLLLLISAFVGEKWRDIYQFALSNGFRFLSYGDSSLLQRI